LAEGGDTNQVGAGIQAFRGPFQHFESNAAGIVSRDSQARNAGARFSEAIEILRTPTAILLAPNAKTCKNVGAAGVIKTIRNKPR